ncbi:hypothetical protein JCM8208_003154 [Rhodotorula glutinis]
MSFCLLLSSAEASPECPRTRAHCRFRSSAAIEAVPLFLRFVPFGFLDSMALPGSTNWTAQVGAAIATLHVIPLLERDLPGHDFILGGLQAIAFYAQALSDRRRREVKAALPQRALPTNELPIIVHMPPPGHGAADEIPQSFAANPTGSAPFQTSTFLNVHGGIEYLAHVKFSSRLGAPAVCITALVGTIHTPVRTYHYLRPAAVVVEQLMLAASSAASHPADEAHAVCAALRNIRYAWNVLHVQAMLPEHTARNSGPHAAQRFAQNKILDALVDMLFPDGDDHERLIPDGPPPLVPAGHQSLAEWWLDKLRFRGVDDIVHQVVTWEHASPVGHDEQRWPTLGDEYSRLRDDLVSVLSELLVAAPTRANGAHDALQSVLALPSLAKSSLSSFEPVGRERGERRSVFA